MIKCVIRNSRNLSRNHHRTQLFTIVKRTISNSGDTFRNVHTPQVLAVPERIPANASQSIRKHNVPQCRTSIECALSNILNVPRHIGLFQLITGIEGIVANCRHALGKNCGSDVLPVGIPGSDIRRSIVGWNRSAAGNVQHTVFCQDPGQSVAGTQSDAGQLLQLLGFHRGLGLAVNVLIDLPAAGTGIVGIVAGIPIGCLHGLGLYHLMAQSRDRHIIQRNPELGRFIPVEFSTDRAAIVFPVAGLGAGGILDLDLGQLMVLQRGQGLILNGCLLRARFVLEYLMAGFTGIVCVVAVLGICRSLCLGLYHSMAQGGDGSIVQSGLLSALLVQVQLAADGAGKVSGVAILRTGCRRGLGLFHGVAQCCKGLVLNGRLLPGKLVLIYPAADPAGVVGVVALLRTGGISRSSQRQLADMVNAVVNIGVGKARIVPGDLNAVPGCLIAAKIDIRQRTVAIQCILANACHRVRNINSFQPRAVKKHPIRNICNTAWNTEACQARAAIKSIASNTCHILRDSDAGQAAAAGKSRVANARHTLRNAHTRQAAAAEKHRITDACYPFRNGHIGQASAAGKRPISNAFHRLRNADAYKAAAIFKCTALNTRDALRDIYTSQRCAA